MYFHMDVAFQKVSWPEIKHDIQRINLKLYSVIEKISPSNKFYLYKIKYPFAQHLVKAGKFILPTDNKKYLPIDSDDLSDEIKKDLKYSNFGLPAGIVLKNSYELVINTPRYLLPVLVSRPGDVFALWKQLDSMPYFHPIKLFDVIAGARTSFMLPNVSDLAFHANLRRDFGVNKTPPKELLDQFDIFKKIYQESGTEWNCELLFFTDLWIENAKKDAAWKDLYLYFLESAWHSSGYERNRMFYDFAISYAQANRNLKPNPYLTDTVRHLIMLSLGAGVGYAPATDNTQGPYDLIQEAYINSYGMKKYAPTIMQPEHLRLEKNSTPIYYSLQFPTTIEFSPRSRQIATALSDLSEIKHIMDSFIDEMKKEKLNIDDTILNLLTDQIQFKYFHSKPDRFGEILLSNQIPDFDKRLRSSLANFKSPNFAQNGAFLRGCIQIAYE